MFTAGRYVIVDDKPDDIRPLVEALHAIGAPCIGIHYEPDRDIEPRLFEGVRVLFLDLHLVPGQATSSSARYAVLAELLQRCISRHGGPYVAVLWTSHAEERAAFTAYLEAVLEEPHQRPLAVLALDKNKYLGAAGPESGTLLRQDVERELALTPQLHALLSWERDVLAAAGAVLAELIGLIPPESRTTETYADNLDAVLSQLAVAAAGKQHVARDQRGAVNAALAPILQDRVLNAIGSGSKELWSTAVTKHESLPLLGNEPSGRMNRMLHLACPPAEPVAPFDWGAVIELPPAELPDAAMTARFGIPLKTIMSTIFFVERHDRQRCTPCLVRLGAVCDYAQRKEGPIPYVMGVLIPAAVERRSGPKPASEFVSPVFVLDDSREPFYLYVNARLQISLTEPVVAGWATPFRIREQLLMSLIGHVNGYASRPGIIKLPN